MRREFEVSANEPKEMLEGWAKGGAASQKERFGLVRIFTQSRRAAEGLIRVSEGILRDGSIFGGPFYA